MIAKHTRLPWWCTTPELMMVHLPLGILFLLLYSIAFIFPQLLETGGGKRAYRGRCSHAPGGAGVGYFSSLVYLCCHTFYRGS